MFLSVKFVFFFFSGYMQAHVSYLTEECQTCLLLLTIDRELFFTLSEAKQKIVEVFCIVLYSQKSKRKVIPK